MDSALEPAIMKHICGKTIEDLTRILGPTFKGLMLNYKLDLCETSIVKPFQDIFIKINIYKIFQPF